MVVHTRDIKKGKEQDFASFFFSFSFFNNLFNSVVINYYSVGSIKYAREIDIFVKEI